MPACVCWKLLPKYCVLGVERCDESNIPLPCWRLVADSTCRSLTSEAAWARPGGRKRLMDGGESAML